MSASGNNRAAEIQGHQPEMRQHQAVSVLAGFREAGFPGSGG
jgi:hypothetical protein